MKLQKFIKDKKVKNTFLVSIVAFVFVIGGVTLYRTFALYEQKESFNVLVGVVPPFTKVTPNAVQEENEVSSDEEIQESVPSVVEEETIEEENTTEDNNQNEESIEQEDSVDTVE